MPRKELRSARKKGHICEKQRLDLLEKSSDLQERGRTCNLCALIKVRIVKSLISESFVLYRSKISGNFCF